MKQSFLTNQRVTLRAVEPEDLESLYRWENDTLLWTVSAALSPFSKFSLREYIVRQSVEDIFSLRQLKLMIVDRPSGDTIGSIDLYDFDPVHQRAFVGIIIDRFHQRQGLGSAALEALSDYAFSFLRLHQLCAYISIDHFASLSLFAKVGFEQTAILHQWIFDQEWKDVALMQKICSVDQGRLPTCPNNK